MLTSDVYTPSGTGLQTLEQPVVSVPAPQPEFSSKMGWGGARPNSGGPRPNSGGARPNSGPKPKSKTPPIIATYAADHAHWRVFATFGQAEISATRELTRQGYETYLPLIVVRRRDRVIETMWHEVSVPMCAGYGFIRLTQAEAREPIMGTRGVRDLLHRPDGRLWKMPDCEIDRLRADEPTRLKLQDEGLPPLAAHSKVRVLAGAFADHVGVVVECDGVRTLIELPLFGRPTPVWVARGQVG